MQTFPLVRKTLATLPVLAGALLVAAAVTHAVVASFVVPEFSGTALWSMFAEMLPIPGGAVAAAPEIDPGSAANAVALVLGSTLLLVGLRRKR